MTHNCILVATVATLLISTTAAPSRADSIGTELYRQVPKIAKHLTIHHLENQGLAPDNEIASSNWTVTTFIRLITQWVHSTVDLIKDLNNHCPAALSQPPVKVKSLLDPYYGVDVDQRLMDAVSGVA